MHANTCTPTWPQSTTRRLAPWSSSSTRQGWSLCRTDFITLELCSTSFERRKTTTVPKLQGQATQTLQVTPSSFLSPGCTIHQIRATPEPIRICTNMLAADKAQAADGAKPSRGCSILSKEKACVPCTNTSKSCCQPWKGPQNSGPNFTKPPVWAEAVTQMDSPQRLLGTSVSSTLQILPRP